MRWKGSPGTAGMATSCPASSISFHPSGTETGYRPPVLRRSVREGGDPVADACIVVPRAGGEELSAPPLEWHASGASPINAVSSSRRIREPDGQSAQRTGVQP